MNNNNRLIRNNQGRIVRVLETPTGSPRIPRGNQRNPRSPPPMSPRQRRRQRVLPVARRLNFSGAEYTKEDFYNEIKQVLNRFYPDHDVNNVRNLENYKVRHVLNRRLTQQELEWLGTTRKITEQNVKASKRKANEDALQKKYGVSPAKQPKNNGITYYDDTFNVRSPQKVKNKVFLMTELNKNDKVTRVYNRGALNKLMKQVGPFTQIPFKNYHIKNYKNKNKIEKEIKNFKNLGFNVKNVTEAYAQNHLRPLNTFTPTQKDTIKKIIQTLKRNNIPRNIKTLLQQKLAFMITKPTMYEKLGLSQVVYARNLTRIVNTIPKNIINLL